LEMQQNAGDSMEFLENVKIDLFPREVYVFTPKGEIMVLKRGSTPVDFAYAVHTDVGNRCVAAKIDRKLAPLRTPLMNGQTVEVITAGNASPNPAWLNFAVTGKARGNIRNYLKNLKTDEAVQLGRRLLDNELATHSSSIDQLSPEIVGVLLQDFKMKSMDALLEDIGLGNRMAMLVARRLMPKDMSAPKPGKKGLKRALSRYMPSWLWGEKVDASQPLMIKGTEGMVVSFAKCCRPIPGDPIVGFVTSGRGIVIHTESCKNLAEYRKRPEKWIESQWEDDVKGDFTVEVRVDVLNQRGVLATVAAAIAEMGANIDNVNMEDRDGRYSTMSMVIDVHSRHHLASLMRKLRSIEPVMKIVRSRG